MARMKSRTLSPPGSWQVLIPAAGMNAPYGGGFSQAVEFLLTFSMRNPGLAQKHNLPTTRAAAEDWVDSYNAARCIAGGFTSFVDMTTPTQVGAIDAAVAEAQKKSPHAHAAGGNLAQRGRAAYAAYAAMFGATGPVAKEVAEARAAVCLACPHNDTKRGLSAYFTDVAAREIMGILGALKDLDLSLSRQGELGVCDTCSCPLRAKLFAPLSVTLEKMPAEVWPLLPRENPKCWLLTESGRP